MRKLFLLILVPLLYSAQGQVVNIESLRSFADSNGFHGIINLNMDYRRNTRDLLNLTNNVSLKYQKQRHIFDAALRFQVCPSVLCRFCKENFPRVLSVLLLNCIELLQLEILRLTCFVI